MGEAENAADEGQRASRDPEFPGTALTRHLDRLTERARNVLVAAQDEARSRNHDQVRPEHMLLALLAQDEGLGVKSLARSGVDLVRMREQLGTQLGRGSKAPSGRLLLTEDCKQAVQLALQEARRLQQSHIGTEHLMIGLMQPTHSRARTFRPAAPTPRRSPAAPRSVRRPWFASGSKSTSMPAAPSSSSGRCARPIE